MSNTPLAGAHAGMSFKEYLALDLLSSSEIVDFWNGGPHFCRSRKLSSAPDTSSMALGTDLHCLLLEPERFRAEYEITADNWAKNPGKAERRDAIDRGKVPIQERNHAFLVEVADCVKRHPVAGGLFELGYRRELSAFAGAWKLPLPEHTRDLAIRHSMMAKIRMDLLTRQDAIICDLKSAAPTNFSTHGFFRHAWAMGYPAKAAFYVDVARAAGLDVKHFCWLVIRNERPVEVRVIRLPRAWLELARDQYMWAAERLIEARAEDRWDSPYDRIEDLPPPADWHEQQIHLGPSWATDTSAAAEPAPSEEDDHDADGDDE